MDYTVLDVYELLQEAEVDPVNVRRFTAVYGDYDSGGWTGQVCMIYSDGTYGLVERTDGVVRTHDSEESMTPDASDDYIESPNDLNRWLRDGATEESLPEY
jgi:hypothetical protein